jgi:hypothetical protein
LAKALHRDTVRYLINFQFWVRLLFAQPLGCFGMKQYPSGGTSNVFVLSLVSNIETVRILVTVVLIAIGDNAQ